MAFTKKTMHKSLARFKKMKKIVSVAIKKMWLFARQSQELVMFEGLLVFTAALISGRILCHSVYPVYGLD